MLLTDVNALNAVKGLLYLGLVGFILIGALMESPLIARILWIVAFVYIERNCSYPGGCCAVSGARAP